MVREDSAQEAIIGTASAGTEVETNATEGLTSAEDAEIAGLPRVNDSFSLGGRLQHYWTMWSDPVIVKMLQSGLSWKWTTEIAPTYKMSFRDQQNPLLEAEVAEMLDLKVIARTPYSEVLFMGGIFPKIKPNGKVRTILDISTLNLDISNPSFQMLKLADVPLIIQQNDLMISVDLSSAYWHVPMDPVFSRYRNEIFRFIAMPFGISIAPRLFTRMMREIMRKISAAGIRAVIYMDDLLILAGTQEEMVVSRFTALDLLRTHGFIINWRKSQLVPTREIIFLGITWNSKEMTVWLGATLIKKLQDKMIKIKKAGVANGIDMEGVTGSLVHASFVIEECSRLVKEFTRSSVNPRRADREKPTELEQEFHNLYKTLVTTRFLFKKKSLLPPEVTSQMMVDASLRGWGAAVVSVSPPTTAAGLWTNTEKKLPIAVLEAKAVMEGLRAFTWTKSQLIVVLSDSKSAVGAINKGGSTRSLNLHKVTKHIWKFKRIKRLQLKLKYIKGKHNIIADQLSRQGTAAPGEWSLSQEAFQRILDMGHDPKVDLFATEWNHKLPVYCTLYKCAGTELREALSLDWNQWDEVYLFPPPLLMLKVLEKISHHQGKSLLVFPAWGSRPWYQLILARAKLIVPLHNTGLWQGPPDSPTSDSPACWSELRLGIFTN